MHLTGHTVRITLSITSKKLGGFILKPLVHESGKISEERVVLITGGYGFSGSNLVRYWLEHYPNDKIILLDGMTYAARPKYVKDFVEEIRKHKNPDIHEVIVDIRDQLAVARVMQKFQPDLVLHLAAESHVCRSIAGPKAFMETNILGTFNMIEEFYQLWRGYKYKSKRFLHVSTDEVFGELQAHENPFSELNNIRPRSPYAASKASSDHIVQCYHHTYGIPTIITNCSNNFGPNQHEEKLIPATIWRLLNGEPARLYSNGLNVRDWLFVEDHCRALALLTERGEPGQRYCIGGDQELSNIEIVERIHEKIFPGGSRELRVEYTADRPTDDRRYAIDCSRLKKLGWSPQSSEDFEKNLAGTIEYYMREFTGAGREASVPSAREGVSSV